MWTNILMVRNTGTVLATCTNHQHVCMHFPPHSHSLSLPLTLSLSTFQSISLPLSIYIYIYYCLCLSLSRRTLFAIPQFHSLVILAGSSMQVHSYDSRCVVPSHRTCHPVTCLCTALGSHAALLNEQLNAPDERIEGLLYLCCDRRTQKLFAEMFRIRICWRGG